LVPGVLGFASSITPEKIIELTNQKRMENGLLPLKVNNKLSQAARKKAADMFALNYWAHISPRGITPWQFIKESGYFYLYAGENLARDFATSEGVVNAWMASPTHKANILNNKYQEIGVAVVNGVLQDEQTTLVVQMFATPATKPAVISQRASQQEDNLSLSQQPTKEASPATILKVIPTVTPVPPKTEIRAGSVRPLFSGFSLTRILSLFLGGLLLFALFLDGWVMRKKKITRASGHNLIHGTFLLILILMILLSQPGVIL